jgi:hypothetical protein
MKLDRTSEEYAHFWDEIKDMTGQQIIDHVRKETGVHIMRSIKNKQYIINDALGIMKEYEESMTQDREEIDPPRRSDTMMVDDIEIKPGGGGAPSPEEYFSEEELDEAIKVSADEKPKIIEVEDSNLPSVFLSPALSKSALIYHARKKFGKNIAGWFGGFFTSKTTIQARLIDLYKTNGYIVELR